MEKERLCQKDNDFLSGLGIGSILPENIKKIELVGILKGDKDFQKELRGFFLG